MRPAVAVVVPFAGDGGAARTTLAAIERLELRDGDELMVADNSASGVVAAAVAEGGDVIASPGLDGLGAGRVLRADRERSSYHARNVGARATRSEWILFIDADCIPAPNLLDAYFVEPIPDDCAVVGGQIGGDPAQRSFIARYSRSRNYLSQTEGLHGKAGSAVATANMLVRRRAFDAVGGFTEGIRSGGDVDFCWRLMRAGWRLIYRPEAAVVHRHRESLPGFLAQVARYGAGARWLERHHPGASPPWPLVPGLLGSARDIAVNVRRGRFEEAAYRAVDAIGLVAHNVGYLGDNRAPRA